MWKKNSKIKEKVTAIYLIKNNIFILFLLLHLFDINIASSQEASSPIRKPELDDASDFLSENITIETWKALSAIVGTFLASGIVAFIIGIGRGFKKGYNSFINSLKWPINAPQGKRKNTILVLGLGRSGKSTFIDRFISPADAKRAPMTKDFKIKYSTKTHDGEVFDFHTIDYVGQDFSTLIRGFVTEQIIPESPVKYGAINTIMFVLDIFPDEPDGNYLKQHPSINESRVEAHLSQWNRTALDAVFGLTEETSLKLVVIFINKIDKWAVAHNKENKELIVSKFNSLINDLKFRVQGISDVHIVLGSAETGLGAVGEGGITPYLYQHSIPMLKESENGK